MFMNSLLFNNLKFQFAAIFFLLILEIIYFIRPKLKLLSTKIFTVLMVSSFLYLLFDIATIFALVYFDYVPLWFVRFTHQGFIVFLEIALSSIYLYIDFFNRNEKRYSEKKLFFIISIYFISFLFVLFAPMEYKHTAEEGLYSYGLMADSVYCVIVFYSALTFVNTIKCFRKGINRKKQVFVFCTMGIWTLFGVTQIIFPSLLISSVGVAAMVLLMFLSLENPSEYIDKETHAFNATALKTVLAEYKHRKRRFTIINIDLEDISIIENKVGDSLIIETLIKIKEFVEKSFKIKTYRLNNTSLTFILNGQNLLKKETIIETLEDRFNNSWVVKNTNINLRAHLDIICCPVDFPYDGKVSELISFISECHTFTESTAFVRAVDKMITENRKRQMDVLRILTEAIETNAIEMYYQPIFNVKEGKFTNVEALVRLSNNLSTDFISPEEFIPLAEKNGLIMELSHIIFSKVFSFMQKNKLIEKGVKHMEINLSGIQSVDSDLPRLMKSLLQEYNISPENVNLEITESVAVTSGYMLKKNMEELKRFGCTFSMDDFGTGYSNLSQIIQVDFELIKIDKSLLWPCFKKENPFANNAKILLDNLINMILKFGHGIVVEGVETREQFEYLKNLGVTYIQGYYFSKPLNSEQYLSFIYKNNK